MSPPERQRMKTPILFQPTSVGVHEAENPSHAKQTCVRSPSAIVGSAPARLDGRPGRLLLGRPQNRQAPPPTLEYSRARVEELDR
eukprot:scaffold201947_cov30-Tisochrysis_lutea.AAC.1